MTAFTLNSASTQEAWSTDYVKEYTRTSGFLPYMKGGASAVIRINRDLTRKAGDVVNIPYFQALSGSGVTGSTALKGSEEALGNYGIEIRVSQLRNGVLIQESDLHKTDLQIANIARESLRTWSAATLRADIVNALASVPVAVSNSPDNTKLYSAASETEKDAWNDANSDRLVFGTATTAPTGDNSADLAGIASGEVLSAAVLDYAIDKFEATSTFSLNPFATDDTAGREYKVLFVGTAGFNQLRADDDIKTAMSQAWTRDEMKNPIFRGGDLLWNGTIIRKIPEISAVGTVGTDSASVSPFYLCGSNALGVAWASLPEARKDVDDYGEKQGVAIREVRGVKKLTASITDLGLVTGFYATA